MKTYKKIIIGIFFLLPALSFAEDCSSDLINWSDYDHTLDLLQKSYHQGDFQLVEQSLDCLLESNKKFSSGKPGAIAVYWFFRKEMPGPGADAADELRIQNWGEAIPNSKFVEFAKLRFSYSQAWNVRGNRYANKTGLMQFSSFDQLLSETKKLILADGNKFKETPISYNLLLAVALDLEGVTQSSMDIFLYGVENWPNYYDFYEVLLSRLTPKWGGSWEEVDNFINYWASNYQHADNSAIYAKDDSFYARLYQSIHKSTRVDPRTTEVEWSKLKPSLISLYSKYPVAEHYALASSYACLYNDPDMYSQTTSELNEATSDHWISGTSKEACDNFFNYVQTQFLKE